MTQDWGNFAVITGAAAGALTGLLFVAVSVNPARISGHPALRAQAGRTLVMFMLPLLLAILIVLPGWSPVALGTALVVLAVVAATALWLIGRGKDPAGDSAEDRLARLLDRASPYVLFDVLTLVAGCLQLAGSNGLYWAAGASVLSLVSGVANAWLFLTRS